MAVNAAGRLPLKTGGVIVATNESNSAYIGTEYSYHARIKLDKADEKIHGVAQKPRHSHFSQFPVFWGFFLIIFWCGDGKLS